jgi:hypothetical protein
LTRLNLRLLRNDLRKTQSEYDDAVALGHPRVAAALANHHASLRHQEVVMRMHLARLTANT